MTTESQTPSRRYAIGAASFEAPSLAPGLYIVATPIGNLGDMTVRGLAALAAAGTILCEDTRTTGKLLERYGIRTPLAPYHEHNAAKVRPGILARLKEGAAIALVSDAGMPLVSDPGYRLVREATEAGIAVTCCPGASAVLTGLALSGLPSDRFAFLGFLPPKAGERRKLLAAAAAIPATLIVFESPHRIVEPLDDIPAAMPKRPVAVARELTKLHEEVLRGTAAELAATLQQRPAIKGEITLLVGPPDPHDTAVSEDELQAAITETLNTLPAAKAAAAVAKRYGLAKADVYARILARKSDG